MPLDLRDHPFRTSQLQFVARMHKRLEPGTSICSSRRRKKTGESLGNPGKARIDVYFYWCLMVVNGG